jgi:YHS domain-containing protein
MTRPNLSSHNRSIWLFGLWLVLFCAATLAQADAPVFNAKNGTALSGYDVVTYFTTDSPQPGDPKHAVMWKGAVWQFVSRSNRERFEANPRAYAPQYGGYCAYGVSRGLVVRSDPMLFKIRDGKLYLIHNKSAWGRWVGDIAGHIAEADERWPAMLANQ